MSEWMNNNILQNLQGTETSMDTQIVFTWNKLSQKTNCHTQSWDNGIQYLCLLSFSYYVQLKQQQQQHNN